MRKWKASTSAIAYGVLAVATFAWAAWALLTGSVWVAVGFGVVGALWITVAVAFVFQLWSGEGRT